MAKGTTSRRKAAAPEAASAADSSAPAQPASGAPGLASSPAPPASPAAASDEAPAALDVPKGHLTRVLVASASPRGRRRAGQAFVKEPVELHASDATLALLEGDPQLIVKRG